MINFLKVNITACIIIVLAVIVITICVKLILSQTHSNKTVFYITELYTGSDQQSHFREILVDLPIQHPLGNYSDNQSANTISFREFNSGLKFDWHTAPQTQYIVYLAGKVKVKTSSAKRIFKAGDILLANDLTGKGHTTTTLIKGRSLIIRVPPTV